MAALCASSSSSSLLSTTTASSSNRNRSSFPCIGFSWSTQEHKCHYQLRPSAPLRYGTKRASFVVRCEKQKKLQPMSVPVSEEELERKRNRVKKAKKPIHIPLDQRWMFQESELAGPDIWNTTWYPKAADHVQIEKPWYVVDATDKILGRLASTIAIHIRGKNLATYTPSVDMGAFVIVVNAEKVAVSGKKRTQKLYRRHSGRPGGMKVETFDQLQNRIPERIIEHAVRGMLPKGRLGRALFNHLKVYKGPDHPHEAQKPTELPIRDKRIQMVG